MANTGITPPAPLVHPKDSPRLAPQQRGAEPGAPRLSVPHLKKLPHVSQKRANVGHPCTYYLLTNS